jgi:RNA polymerase sigma-70 factor (ECF subfamily)
MAMAHDKTEEAALLARCRTGDEGAFRRLMDLHHQHVYRTSFALTGDADTAADITQETFLKAWRGLPSFRGNAALSTWLTRLALNAARDHLRRRRVHAPFAGWRGSAAPSGAAADDPAGAIAERDELGRALDGLPARAREVVALRYGRDLTVAEIAAILDCPEGTVKSRLNGALARLRLILRQQETAVAGSAGSRPEEGRR